MSSVVISGDTSGQVTLAAPAVAGTNTATLPVATGELSMLGGTGQNWTDVTASRASGTTYTNSTGKPIQVWVQNNTSNNPVVVVNGVTINPSLASQTYCPCFIVPTGQTYSVTMTTINKWSELR